jgi:hypothetical protein
MTLRPRRALVALLVAAVALTVPGIATAQPEVEL